MRQVKREAREILMADRTYTIEGKVYPSVTTLLSVINKPFLMPWAASEERKDILETPGVRDLPLGKFAYQNKSQAALDVGSFVHNLVEAYHKEWDDSAFE